MLNTHNIMSDWIYQQYTPINNTWQICPETITTTQRISNARQILHRYCFDLKLKLRDSRLPIFQSYQVSKFLDVYINTSIFPKSVVEIHSFTILTEIEHQIRYPISPLF